MAETTTQHTPGPWTVEPYRYSKRGHAMVRPAAVMAAGRYWIAPEVCGHDFGASSLANARLIAAAPEMLEALGALATAAENRDSTMGDPLRLLECKAALENAARAARSLLRRARGED